MQMYQSFLTNRIHLIAIHHPMVNVIVFALILLIFGNVVWHTMTLAAEAGLQIMDV